MSLISFIKNLLAGIASLFNRLPASLKAAVALSVTITENLKKAIDSPVADVLTAVIPGEADDVLVAALRAALPRILTELQLTENCINNTEPATLLQCALQTLSQLSAGAKNAVLHSVSVLLAQIAAEGKLSWSDGVHLLEWYYQQKFKSPGKV